MGDSENVLLCVCAQLCPTLCDPIDSSLPGSSDHGIFQARILEWVAPLLEETEMPKAQLRPSGGSPLASSREGAVAWGPQSLPGSQAGASLSVSVQPNVSAGDRQG